MADMRISTFLPTIKCSMCARDIEISQMGDHVCGGPGEPTPPPDSHGIFDKMFKQSPANGPPFLKPLKSLPPRVDTNAANRPFIPPDQLTPVSASPSRSRSPFSSLSALDPKRSPNPFAKPSRSATTPIPRAPPSPDVLSSNLDCAFPPFPTSKPTPAKPAVGSGYSGGKKQSESNPMYAPLSPRNIGDGGLLQRMNTIAPGPFDPNAKGESAKGHRRQATSGSVKDIMISPTTIIDNGMERPATAGPGHSRSSTTSSSGSKSGVAPPRMPRKNGYGGFGPPGADGTEPLIPELRSQTFPLLNNTIDGPFRRPSEGGNSLRSRQRSNDSPLGQIQRAPSNSPPRQRNPSLGPDLSRPLPPRGGSTRRVDGRPENAPPVPASLNLAAEFGIGNPYHTSSESQSSDNSAYSEESLASSRSSPPRRSRRQASDETKMDTMMANLESSMSDLQPPRRLPSNASHRANASEQYARPPPRNIDTALLSPESPMDPAIQSGRLSPVPHPRIQNTSRSLSPFRSSSPMERPSMRRTATSSSSRPSNPSKGNCKGCGEAIRGKSVSSADGRLTGRYHKQCFNCTTCSEPFQTATFYVIADAPYCERHYHKLNNSVCCACDRGIEGQYLESERKQKFHPQCLACSDCKRILKNDYFEMGGRVYCERDAFRRAQQNRGRGGFLGMGMGPGSNRMERRTTRLMMMM